MKVFVATMVWLLAGCSACSPEKDAGVVTAIEKGGNYIKIKSIPGELVERGEDRTIIVFDFLDGTVLAKEWPYDYNRSQLAVFRILGHVGPADLEAIDKTGDFAAVARETSVEKIKEVLRVKYGYKDGRRYVK